MSASLKSLHNINKQFITNLISAMPVAEVSLTLSFLYQYQYVRDSKSEIMLWCCVCHSVFVFRFDLLHRRKSSPNIECIFSAKSFSLWNLSQLT